MSIKTITKTTYINEDGFTFTFEPIEESLKIEKTKEGFKAKYLTIEEDPEDPREWDNFGNMVCFHNKYNLGDKHDFKDPEEFKEFLNKNKKTIVKLPIILYDHSGITISTNRNYPFNCPFDSGQVGYIYVTYEDIKKEFNIKKITKKHIQKTLSILESEIKTYDMYITGDVYILVVEDYDKNKESIDYDTLGNCFGYSYALEELKEFEEF